MKRVRSVALLLTFVLTSCGDSQSGGGQSGEREGKASVALQDIHNEAFSIKLPEGWRLETVGKCSTLGVFAYDPSEPLRHFFCFGLIGPFFTSQAQQHAMLAYLQSGGYQLPAIMDTLDGPILNPPTPERVVSHLGAVARMKANRRDAPWLPLYEDMTVLGENALPNSLQVAGNAGIVRAVYSLGGRAGQGIFSGVVVPSPPVPSPFGAVEYASACLFTGMSAPQPEFAAWEPVLRECLESYSINEKYADACLRAQAASSEGALRAGRILGETSQLIADSWHQRAAGEDIRSARFSDATRGVERLVDPDSGRVYEFENGFYDRYRVNPEIATKPNLQPLPENDPAPWRQPTVSGQEVLR